MVAAQFQPVSGVERVISAYNKLCASLLLERAGFRTSRLPGSSLTGGLLTLRHLGQSFPIPIRLNPFTSPMALRQQPRPVPVLVSVEVGGVVDPLGAVPDYL